MAYNDGYTELWSQDLLAQWANLYQPQSRHYTGGYGYLNVGGRAISTLYLDRPAGSRFERGFGVGYYRRVLRTDRVTVAEAVYAPFGNDPLLLHDVTITNDGPRTRTATWYEYWDVTPQPDDWRSVQRWARSAALERGDADAVGRAGRRARDPASAAHLRVGAGGHRVRIRDLGAAVLRQRDARRAGRGGR